MCFELWIRLFLVILLHVQPHITTVNYNTWLLWTIAVLDLVMCVLYIMLKHRGSILHQWKIFMLSSGWAQDKYSVYIWPSQHRFKQRWALLVSRAECGWHSTACHLMLWWKFKTSGSGSTRFVCIMAGGRHVWSDDDIRLPHSSLDQSTGVHAAVWAQPKPRAGSEKAVVQLAHKFCVLNRHWDFYFSVLLLGCGIAEIPLNIFIGHISERLAHPSGTVTRNYMCSFLWLVTCT